MILRLVKAKIIPYNKSTMKYTRFIRWVPCADKWFKLCSLIVYSYLSEMLKQSEMLNPTESIFSITSNFVG